MAQYELVFDEGAGKTYRVPVSATPVTIGRSVEAQIRIEHPAVSRVHVSLRLVDEHVLIDYLGSGKGVKINGERIANAILKHGDRFEVGETLFVVNDIERGASPTQPRPTPTMLEKNASNRLCMRGDVKIRAIFERACLLSSQAQDSASSVTGALELALDLVNAQRCFLLWFAGNENGVRVLGALAQNSNNKGPKLNGTLVGTVVRTGAPMLKVDERPLPPEATGDRPSAMCVPLRVNGQVIGALYADSGWSDGQFTSHSLQDLRALVQIVGPTLIRIGTGAPARS